MKMEPEPWFPRGMFIGGGGALEVGPIKKRALLVV